MKDNLNYKSRTAFLVAATILICEAIRLMQGLSQIFYAIKEYRLGSTYYDNFGEDVLPGIVNIISILFLISFAVVLIISKKTSLAVVLVAIISLFFDIYQLIYDLIYSYDMIYWQMSNILFDITLLLLSVWVLLFAVLGYVIPTKRPFIFKLWFIPLCICGAYTIADSIYYISHFFSSMNTALIISDQISGRLIGLMQPCALTFVCLAINLYNKANYEEFKKLEYEESAKPLCYESTPVYSYAEARQTSFQNPAPQFTKPQAQQEESYQYVQAVHQQNVSYTQPVASFPIDFRTADELAKYKKLLDDGAITAEEYEIKKKQLLGI